MNDRDALLVTVVVPVYNVEKYLDRCVESVTEQTYKNLEIILVDDGSTDSCPKMCDEWAGCDSRIKVIHKENQGLGLARNSGLDAARGKYVCFIDSDDFVDSDTIECAVSVAVRDESDVVVFGMRSVSNDGATVLSEIVPCCPKRIFAGAEVQERFLPFLIGPDLKTGEDWMLMASACSCLLDNQLLTSRGFRFVSERDIISEDVYSMLGLYQYVSRVSVINRSFYNYRVNNVSITHVYNPQRLVRIGDFFLASRSYAHTCGYGDEIENRLCIPYLNIVIAALKLLVEANVPRREKLEQLSRLSQSEDFTYVYTILRCSKIGLKKKILLEAIARNSGEFVLALCSLKHGD